METKVRLGDLGFISKHKDFLFPSRYLYQQLLSGEIIYPVADNVNISTPEIEDTHYSFGYCISMRANQLGLSLEELGSKLRISLEELMQICDDSILPWDLNLFMINALIDVLSIDKTSMIKWIDNHEVDPWMLRYTKENTIEVAFLHHQKYLEERKEQEEFRKAVFINQLRSIKK
jgi:transcriptional regulator with XRE-family HTH domain